MAIPVTATKTMAGAAVGFEEVKTSDPIPHDLVEGTGIPEGNGITFSGGDPTEWSINIRAAPGASSTLHYNNRSAGGGFLSAGNLAGGAGSRPWTGAGWSDHSTAAYHLICSENHTATAQGTDFSIVVTPIGGDQSSRIHNTRFNGDGDIINSRGMTTRKIIPTERGRGLEIVRDGSASEVCLVSTFAGNYGSSIRSYVFGGTPISPSATPEDRGTSLLLCGHSGTAFTGAAGAVGIRSNSGPWSDTSRACEIFFETTALNSTTRQRQFVIGAGGHFTPSADNRNDIGSPTSRVRQIYSNNATISTSDDRLKCDDRPLEEKEIAAGIEIARAIKLFKWKSSVEQKGESARIHAGVYAQQVVGIMRNNGLDPMDYGFICYDEWDAIPEMFGDDGETVAAEIPAGDRYGIRYEELSMFVMSAIAARLDFL